MLKYSLFLYKVSIKLNCYFRFIKREGQVHSWPQCFNKYDYKKYASDPPSWGWWSVYYWQLLLHHYKSYKNSFNTIPASPRLHFCTLSNI